MTAAASPDPIAVVDGLLAFAAEGEPLTLPRLLVAALRDRAARGATAITPPPGGLWKLSEISALYERHVGKRRSPSAIRADIEAGAYGTPGSDGGPRLTTAGWRVPHDRVSRLFAGESSPSAAGAADSTPAAAKRGRGGKGVISLVDAREERKAARKAGIQ